MCVCVCVYSVLQAHRIDTCGVCGTCEWDAQAHVHRACVLCVCAYNGHGHQHRKRPGINLACLFLLHIFVGLFAGLAMLFVGTLATKYSIWHSTFTWMLVGWPGLEKPLHSSGHTIEFAIKIESILAMAEPTSNWGFAKRDLCRQFYRFSFFWISEKLEIERDNRTSIS